MHDVTVDASPLTGLAGGKGGVLSHGRDKRGSYHPTLAAQALA